MSRATAGFAQYFPSATRAAKDKAKEREKSKPLNLGSPTKNLFADNRSVHSDRVDEYVRPVRAGGEINIRITDPAPPPIDDNELSPGDILNAVGSASSHSSTNTSVFSGPQPNMSTFGGPRNVNNLTPLTTTNSSPNRIPSPNKLGAQAISSSTFTTNSFIPQNDVSHTQPAMAEPPPRVFARDPNRGIKGEICTYDPGLDPKQGPNPQKWTKKIIYKEFGLVRTHNTFAGERHLFENV